MDQRSTTEAEPELVVPVRPGPAGHAVRLFRTPLGERTAVAFSTAERLSAALGPEQAWVTLCPTALRELTAPIGVALLTVDPQLVAPAPAPLSPTPLPTPVG
ncbi:SAV_915 family protein [Kitasatospora sp. NPDC006697]|uniref:SAV_915 family protein n=1 Tax=Kitasatospora sp. NPDC006697 TaxID=3364020 RepID=UPI0036C48C65